MPKSGRILIAGDHTVWPRPDAVTLQERTIDHQATAVPGNRPITKGQGYSTIAWVPEAEGSWALPLRHERAAPVGKHRLRRRPSASATGV